MASEDVLLLISNALVKLDEEAVLQDLECALRQGVDPNELLEGALLRGLDEVGRQFEERKIFLPEIMVAAEIANQACDILLPHLERKVEQGDRGRVVIGTVRGDVHDIGKSIVVSLLKATGFEVDDLGVDVDPKTFLRAAMDDAADVVGLSALISSAASAIGEAVALLRQQYPAAKVIVGGAATSEAAAEAWGADAYARDAWAGVERIRELCRRR
jgi:5-methyltetrahydrofolate--homocysteine methyltransferase